MAVVRSNKKKGPVKQHRKGRTCKEPGCSCRLSIYNPQEYCYRHHKKDE